jgi:hypothetical protein
MLLMARLASSLALMVRRMSLTVAGTLGCLSFALLAKLFCFQLGRHYSFKDVHQPSWLVEYSTPVG